MAKIHFKGMSLTGHIKTALYPEAKPLNVQFGIQLFLDVNLRIRRFFDVIDPADHINKTLADVCPTVLIFRPLGDGNHLPTVLQGLPLFVFNLSH